MTAVFARLGKLLRYTPKEMYGASFSLKYANEMHIDPRGCLTSALNDLGVRRLRLMSYWDIHEAKRGTYDFTELDWQLELAEEHGAVVTLCLGLRQPRWPESHWPEWAKELPDAVWQQSLYDYIETVVQRYKDRACIISYQLENEAMLKKFGQNGNFDRRRLKQEYRLIKELDPDRPVIMTCSDSWGIPIFGPRPDVYAFSLYRYFYDRGAYRHSSRPALFYHLRALLIRVIKWRRVFIHELQAEPWGPKGTVELSLEEQFKSMNAARVQEAVAFARRTKLAPIDIWGLEWWYWLKITQDQPEIWNDMKKVFKK
jgi:hypothetical protein